MHQPSQCALLSLTFGLLLLASPWARSDDGGEVLNRGPVHEAFANAVVYNPEPGPLVTKAPPAPIEELPPETKPDGTQVVWIPGYWAWDDERNDYLWVSGIWRDLPPGRVWVPGYWLTSDEGARWVAGYWGDAGKARAQVEYIPEAPPPSLEVGPNIPAPSDEAIWVSGFWVWQGHRYIWSPGCWHTVRPDYVWVPASYIWTPHGFIFVGGYWDYVVARRGVVYAPVYFRAGYPFYPGWCYRPRTVIAISVFEEPIFYRPRYAHYYFGDYYAPAYNNVGFQISFSFHSRGGGYDPIYARQCWENRHNPGWERNYRTTYEQHRTQAASRPAPVFAVQESRPDTRGERNNPVQSSTLWQNRPVQTTGPSGNPGKDKSSSNRPSRDESVKQAGPERIEHRNTDTPGSRNRNPVVTDKIPENPQPVVETKRDQPTAPQTESPVTDPGKTRDNRNREIQSTGTPVPPNTPSTTNPFRMETVPGKPAWSTKPTERSVNNPQPAVSNPVQTPRSQPESSRRDIQPQTPTRENRSEGTNRQATTPGIVTSQPQANPSGTNIPHTQFPSIQREHGPQPQNTQQNPTRYVPNRVPSTVPQQSPSNPSKQTPRSQDSNDKSKKSRDENP